MSRLSRFIARGLAALLFVLALASPALGQVDAGRDLLGANLFPPDVILREADQLGLSDPQRDALTNLVRSTKTTMGEGQAKIREATNKLRESLQTESTQDAQVLEQFEALLEIERETK